MTPCNFRVSQAVGFTKRTPSRASRLSSTGGEVDADKESVATGALAELDAYAEVRGPECVESSASMPSATEKCRSKV